MSKLFQKYNKHQVFDLFAENLELIKQHPEITLKGKKTIGYVCPVCNKIFDKEAFSTDYIDHLTLEHVPPGALGGNVKILTCRICNNEQGSKLEKDLVESLKSSDFYSRIPGTSRPARFLVDGKWNTGGKIINMESGGFQLLTSKKSSNHKHYDKLFNGVGMNVKKFDVTIYNQYKKRRPGISLLRIAYLWLYSEFGYASLINPNMHTVRNQILEPEKDILNHVGSLSYDFTDEFEGVNILRKPKELRSFAVAFKTKTEHKERRHLVLLPGPSDPGLQIYDTLKEMSRQQKKIDIQITHLNLDGIITDPNLVFEYHDIWQWLTKS